MDYETFTREKIARLRIEADALEKNLKEFQAATARASAPSRRAGTSEGSAFGAVMDAIQGSGAKGLTLDEMITHAATMGFEVKRNTLRSQLWAAKNKEKIKELEPGRYAILEPTLDLAPYEPEHAGYSGGGFQRTERAASTGPRETFSAELDDEIPF